MCVIVVFTTCVHTVSQFFFEVMRRRKYTRKPHEERMNEYEKCSLWMQHGYNITFLTKRARVCVCIRQYWVCWLDVAQCLQYIIFSSCIHSITCVYVHIRSNELQAAAEAKATSIFRNHYIWFDLIDSLAKQHQLSITFCFLFSLNSDDCRMFMLQKNELQTLKCWQNRFTFTRINSLIQVARS